jgi:hypothetical protein
VNHGQTLSPLASFAIFLSVALVLFALAGLWFRFSAGPAREFYSAMGKEGQGEWSIRISKYFGTIFLVTCGIGCLVMAIHELAKH